MKKTLEKGSLLINYLYDFAVVIAAKPNEDGSNAERNCKNITILKTGNLKKFVVMFVRRKF